MMWLNQLILYDLRSSISTSCKLQSYKLPNCLTTQIWRKSC